MASLGLGWCLDHGASAPDPDLVYQPTNLPGVDANTVTALAWTAGRYGPGASPIDSAAMMLVFHDFMGAVYPSGRIDVDTLSPARLSGFAESISALPVVSRTALQGGTPYETVADITDAYELLSPLLGTTLADEEVRSLLAPIGFRATPAGEGDGRGTFARPTARACGLGAR